MYCCKVASIIATIVNTLSDRQKIILDYLLAQQDLHPEATFSSATILEALSLNVERTTLFRDLDDLCSMQLVTPKGGTKSRTYQVNQNSDAFLEWDLHRPPELRAAVQYNYNILQDYIPNETFWLDGAEAFEANQVQLSSHSDEDYRRVLNSLLIDLTYASSALENVKISWLDTKSLIEFGERPDGLTETEMAIVMNHKDAIRFMCENRADLLTNKRDVCDLHKLLMTGLLGNPQDAGKIRQGIVFFDGSKYFPIGNTFVLDEQFRLFCEKAQAINNPFERSFFTMLMIPYLQPFQDGNKRTSRLCMNLPLISAGLAPFSFTPVKKSEYMFALLAFYERGKTNFMSQLFKQAYAVSAPKYNEIMTYLSQGGTLSTLEHRPRQT